MSSDVDFFAINADDVPRARQFYTTVFGWAFEPWGPPGFYLIATAHNADGGHIGALQERRELVRGQKMTGFECTIVHFAGCVSSSTSGEVHHSPLRR